MTQRILLLLAAAGLLAGCSPRQYFQQPANVEETHDAVVRLEREQAALKEKIDAMEKAMTDQQELLNRNRADMTAQMETMSDQLRQITARLDEMSGRIERRVRTVPPPTAYPPPGEEPVEPAPAAGGDENMETVTPPDEAAPETPDASGPNAEQIYDQAYRDVTRGSYGLAISGFAEFLRLYPDHDLADNAQYWLAECKYVQDDVTGAREEFEKVLIRYPDGDKVAAAHLKLGYCALRLNETDEARRQFNELIRKFPTSEEARSARAKLATLN